MYWCSRCCTHSLSVFSNRRWRLGMTPSKYVPVPLSPLASVPYIRMSLTFRAGAVRAVEAEHPRLDLGQVDVGMNRAGEFFGEDVVGPRAALVNRDDDQALRELQRRLDRICQAAADFGFEDDAIDDRFN